MAARLDEETATVDDVPMRWLRRGEGLPVVLLHGIPTSPELWRHVMPRVSEAAMFAWELVGFGRSTGPRGPEQIGVASQAEYLLRWMDQAGLDRVVLAGHDLGGGVAQIAAVRQPDRVAGLVLTNCIGYDQWPVPAVRVLRAARPLVRWLPPPLLAMGLRSFFHRAHSDDAAAREAAALHLPPYAGSGGPRGLTRQLRALDRNDTVAVQEALPRLDTPAAVLWGDADPFLDMGLGERLAEDLGVPLKRLPDAGHFTPEDRPAEVAAAISRVVEAVL